MAGGKLIHFEPQRFVGSWVSAACSEGNLLRENKLALKQRVRGLFFFFPIKSNTEL